MIDHSLSKRGIEKPTECVSYAEQESIEHLFFHCTVAKQIWRYISSFFSCELGTNSFSVARFWPAHKNHITLNSVCACVAYANIEIPMSLIMLKGST